MKVKMFIALFSVFVISGCVPSLHQLWTKETLVYDETIAGEYTDGDMGWKFTGDPNDKSYDLVITEDKGKKSELTAHLVNVEGQLFFDFYPDGEIEAGDYTKIHLIAVHTFWKVEKKGNGFSLAAMEPDKVDTLLEEKPGLVKHERFEGHERALLTDTPENLQKFLITAQKLNKKVFGEATDFVRKAD